MKTNVELISNKRTPREDPFGHRFLRDEEAVFDYNAWDNVDWPEEKEAEIQQTLQSQMAYPVTEVIAANLLEAPQQHWESFYETHSNKFFMDRKWLIREFPELFQKTGSLLKVLDVGCGVGNTTIPLLEHHPRLFIYSCDFSKRAIETLSHDPRISAERCKPFIWDITEESMQNQVEDGTLDFILCIFVLSAIRPDRLKGAISNLVKLLRPGGMLMIKNKKILLKLCYEVAKHRLWLQKLAERPLVKEFMLRYMEGYSSTLTMVLIYELLMGQWKEKQPTNRQRGLLKKLKVVLEKEAALLNKHGISAENLSLTSSLLPRYVRVNTIRSSFSSTVAKLELSGWKIRRLKKNITTNNYRKLVSRLTFPRVYVDPHVDNLLIFPQNVDLHDSSLVDEGSLILQDKASCLSAFVLKPESGSSVMDVCAAPGMKTTHLAAIMQNRGHIWAFDRDRKRLEFMQQMIDRTGANIIEAACKDFLRLNIYEKKFEKVKFAVVDPPCSGSGIVKRAEFLDESDEIDIQRIQSLANLQVMLLKHAFRIPSLRRLVYSTCSVHWTENEGVILEILQDSELSARFELIDPLPQWRHRGKLGESDEMELRKCLRASPKRDLTNGFFVALFQRRNMS